MCNTMDSFNKFNESQLKGDLANKIISNFSKMDTNGDGRVTEAEINAFCIDEDILSKRNEQKELMIKNMSLYYDTDSDSSESEEV